MDRNERFSYRVRSMKPTSITDAVNQLVAIYAEEFGFDAAEINEGRCWDFAGSLQKMFPEGEILDNRMLTDRDQDWDHAFLLLNGRYYDSEAPEGVEVWTELPCCKRLI